MRTTLAGLKDTVGFTGESDAVVSDGAIEAERSTVPTKSLRLLRAIVAVPEDPTETVIVVGLADMLKSGGAPVEILHAVSGCSSHDEYPWPELEGGCHVTNP